MRASSRPGEGGRVGGSAGLLGMFLLLLFFVGLLVMVFGFWFVLGVFFWLFIY